MKKHILVLALLASTSVNCKAETDTYPSLREFFTAVFEFPDLDTVLPKTSQNISQLAGESDVTVDRYDPSLLIVKANLYGDSSQDHTDNVLRGASDNGPFFVLKCVPDGFKFLGVMEGNTCTPQKPEVRNGIKRAVIRCDWHMSENSHNVNVYKIDSNGLSKVESYSETAK